MRYRATQRDGLAAPSGYELTKEQWGQALTISKELKERKHLLTDQQIPHEAVRLARRVFPEDAATIASVLELDASAGRVVLPPAKHLELTPAGYFREAEDPHAARYVNTLIDEGLELAHHFHEHTFVPFERAFHLAVAQRDPLALRRVAAAMEGKAEEMRLLARK